MTDAGKAPQKKPWYRIFDKPPIADPYSVEGRAKFAVFVGICMTVFWAIVFLLVISKVKKSFLTFEMLPILSLAGGAILGILHFIYTGISANEIAGRKAFWKNKVFF